MAGVPRRPLAETSIPAFDDAWRSERPIDRRAQRFGWDEDSVTRWRAVGLVGGLGLLEAGLYVYDGFGPLLIAGGLCLLVSVLVAAVGGEEYTWAMLVAALLAFAVAIPTLPSGTTASYAPPAYASSGLPLNFSAGYLVALVLGGATLLVLGVVRSAVISRRLDAG